MLPSSSTSIASALRRSYNLLVMIRPATIARPSRVIVAAALAALVAAPAHAEIYRWVDDAGTVHLDDDVARVPEAQRDSARVFKSKSAPAAVITGPTQGAFAARLTRELGLQTSATQDPISILQVVGIYPSAGWDPAAALSTAAVEDVATAARAAARANRVRVSEVVAEAAVLRVSTALGVAAPPPVAVAEPEPPPPPAPIVVAPNILVEAPPPVIVERQAPVPVPVLDYSTYAFGVPFASQPLPRVLGPIPDRITPLSNPAGRLHGPLVAPLRAGPFTRPADL